MSLLAGAGLIGTIGLILGMYTISFGVHRIDQGYVGVYYRGGKMLNYLSYPGYNTRNPYLTSYDQVQVSQQTDSVKNVPCGTSGGVMIYFDQIEVVNQLDENSVIETVRNYTVDYDKIWIYDKINHEINQFCSKHTLKEIYIDKFDTIDEGLMVALQSDINEWAPGIQIQSIRVKKPRLPQNLLYLFEKQAAQDGQFKLELNKQQTIIQKAQTEQEQSVIKAEQDLEVTKLQLNKKLQAAKNEAKVEAISTEMLIAREKATSDSKYFQDLTELTTQQSKLTKEYLTEQAIQAVTHNAEFFIGKNIPAYFVSQPKLDM